MKIKLKRAAGQRIRQGECLIQTQDIQSPEIGLLKEGESYPVHHAAVSYTHLTLPTILRSCRSRWSPYH